jgi:hypothetical protein
MSTIERARIAAALDALGLVADQVRIVAITPRVMFVCDHAGAETWLELVGDWPEPECPSCHAHGSQPHTEYCQLVDHASQLTHAELEPNLAKHVEAARRPVVPGGSLWQADAEVHVHEDEHDQPRG